MEDSQVIHGKGAGALRRAMWGYNDNHLPALTCESVEGPDGEGVTVVELGYGLAVSCEKDKTWKSKILASES